MAEIGINRVKLDDRAARVSMPVRFYPYEKSYMSYIR
jgi:hypothetical protein